MSQIANITVFDGAATPVSHTLIAVSVTREKGKVTAMWREGLAALPLYAQINVTMSIDQLKSGVYKAEQRVSVPVMEAILNQNAAGYTAAPKVAYENTVVTTGYFHPRADTTGRRLVRQLSTNLVNGVTTSVVPVTVGPAPEMFDQLVSVT